MHSIDFRKAVLMLYDHFQSMRKVSQMLKVSIASISRWCKRLDPIPRLRNPRKFTAECRATVKALLLNDPLMTCQEIVSRIAETTIHKCGARVVAVPTTGMHKGAQRMFGKKHTSE